MKFNAIDTPRLDWSGDALAIGLFEEQVELTGDLAELDQKLGGTLAEVIADQEFKGKEGVALFAKLSLLVWVSKIV